MLLTNNYYRITNKVYKFISEENFYFKNYRVISKLVNIDIYIADLKFQNLYFLLIIYIV